MKKHKTGLIFALVMVVSAVLGALLGIGAMKSGNFFLDFGRQIDGFLRANAVWAMALILVVQLGYGLRLLLSARRAVARSLAAPEEEELMDSADQICDRGIGFLSVNSILSMLFLGLGCAGMQSRGKSMLFVLLVVVMFLVVMGTNVYFTSRFVRFAGQLYPEKQASVLSMNFQKEWFASCDEAERQFIGQAAYCSMRAGLSACTAAWLVVTLLAMFFDAGILPILAVTAIFLAISISYLRACRRTKRAL